MRESSPILDRWRRHKTSGSFHRLSAPLEVSHEFRGPQAGHPSNYASVRILADPADDLAVECTASLPESVTVAGRDSLLRAIESAAVDEMVAAEWYPFSGCRLIVRDIGWDDVMSSEVALYKATRGALARLRREGAWDLRRA